MKTETTLSFEDLVKAYIQADTKLEQANGTPKPQPPDGKGAYTIDEWNEYQKQHSKFLAATQRRELLRQQAIEEFRQAEGELRKHIPVAHTWFVTNNKKYAVAIQESNWGGYSSCVVVKTDFEISELPKLSLTYYN